MSALGSTAVLAKVDVEANPDLGARWGIRAIPTIKVFRGGRLIGELVGSLSEDELKLHLGAIVSLQGAGAVADAEELLRLGDRAGAEAAYRAAYEEERGNTAALLGLGRLLAEKGKAREAADFLSAIPNDAEEHVFAQALLADIRLRQWCDARGGRAAVQRRLAADPGDVDARLGLGCCLAADGMHREALRELLAVAAADAHLRSGAARAALDAVFAVIGPQNSLTGEYRRRLDSL